MKEKKSFQQVVDLLLLIDFSSFPARKQQHNNDGEATTTAATAATQLRLCAHTKIICEGKQSRQRRRMADIWGTRERIPVVYTLRCVVYVLILRTQRELHGKPEQEWEVHPCSSVPVVVNFVQFLIHLSNHSHIRERTCIS